MMNIQGLSFVPFVIAVLFITLASSADYTPISSPSTTTGSVLPCDVALYSLEIANPSTSAYLRVELTSESDGMFIEVSSDQMRSPNTTYYSAIDIENPSFDIVCEYHRVSTWYFTISNDKESATFTLKVSEPALTITPLTVGNETSVNAHTYTPGYNTEYDFFSFSLPDAPAVGQQLEVTLDGSTISQILLNVGSTPYLSTENGCVIAAANDESELVLDYCAVEVLYTSVESKDFFIAVKPAAEGAYKILVDTPAPHIQTIDNSVFHGNMTTAGQINYYSYKSDNSSAQILNITIENVQNGLVQFEWSFTGLPFIDCWDTNCEYGNCCTDVSTSCQLVIQPCNVQDGEYYIGVRQLSFTGSSHLPLTYDLQVTTNSLPKSADLKEGIFFSAAVSQANYNHYEFDQNNFDDDDLATLNLHLYVDSANDPDLQTVLYVNADSFAGSGTNTSCYGNVAFCAVSGTQGSCTIQINPCEYHAHDDWFASVYAGSQLTFYGSPIEYTLVAELKNPTVLETPYLVFSQSLGKGQYDHYKLDSDLLPDGGAVNVNVFDVVGGDLTIFLNFAGLAGTPTRTCPSCYNHTSSHTVAERKTFEWTLANCYKEINNHKDAIYLSAFNEQSTSISYSITVAPQVFDDVIEGLSTDYTMVGSVGPGETDSYEVESEEGGTYYLRFTLTLVNGTSPRDILLTLTNTSNLNCIPGTEEQEVLYNTQSFSCQPTLNGYCSIVLQNCVYNTSSEWVAQVHNSGSKELVYYNVWYEIYDGAPKSLDNYQVVPASVRQNVFNQYKYEAEGEDSLVIEVFFDHCEDINGDPCVGALYVADNGPTGPHISSALCQSNKYNSTSANSNERAVYSVSGCSLAESALYFSVGTTSDLSPNYPLRYTVQVKEFSYSVPVVLNSTSQGQLYSGQRVYHTFSYTPNPSMGSLVYAFVTNEQDSSDQGSDVLAYSLAANGAPSEDTCPCYPYLSSTWVEYCETSNTDWSVMVQSSAPPTQLVGYTIFVGEFSQQPAVLELGVNVPASVQPNLYSYYTLDSTVPSDSQLVLTLSSISGGSLRVYYGFEHPPTANCNDGNLPICDQSSCSYQIQSCIGSPSYISTRGEVTGSYKAITYEISLSEVSSVQLSSTAAESSVAASFTQYYNYTTELTPSSEVTFSLANVVDSEGSSPSYTLTAYPDSLCAATELGHANCNQDSCSLTLAACDLGSGTFYLSVSSKSGNLTFDISASTFDFTSGADEVPAAGKSYDLTAGQWKTVFFTVAADPKNNLRSLQYSITPESGTISQAYLGFERVTPECYDNNESSGSVGACCLKTGRYYLLFRSESDSTNVVVSFSLRLVADFTATDLTGTFGSEESNAIQEFTVTQDSFDDHLGFWTMVQLNESLDFYWEQVSAAGPQQSTGYCLTNSQTGTGSTVLSLMNCDFESPALFSDPFFVGSTWIGLQLTSGTLVDATITSGTYVATALKFGESQDFTMNTTVGEYYSLGLDATSFDALQNLQITVLFTTEDSPLDVELFGESPCDKIETPAADCNGTQCVWTLSTCSGLNTYYLFVEGSEDSSTFTIKSELVPVVETVNEFQEGGSKFTSQTGTNYYSVPAPAVGNSQYINLTIVSEDGDDSDVTVRWSIAGEPICFQEFDQLRCSDDADGIECEIVITSCVASQNTTYYFEVSVSGDTEYTISYVGLVTATVTDLKVNTVVTDSVFEDSQVVYSLALDYDEIQFGQQISLTVTGQCGDVLMYVNQGSLAVPGCSIGEPTGVTHYDIPACTVSTSTWGGASDPFFITVFGTEDAFPEYGLPTRFSLNASVTGQPQSIVNVGATQLVESNGDDSTIYLYALQAFEDFAGQVKVSLSLSNPDTGLIARGAALLNVYFNEIPFCAETPDHQLFVNGTRLTTDIFLNACELSSVQSIYFQFVNATAGANFEIITTRPFIRDLDYYTTVPQTGSVVPNSQATRFVDEEYFRIHLNNTVPNFQFSAWLEQPVSNKFLLQASQILPPASCFTGNQLSKYNITEVQGGKKLIIDWCELNPHLQTYMTVSLADTVPAEVAHPYTLYYSETLETPPEVLQANTPLCDIVEAESWTFYVIQLDQLSNSYFELNLTSINSEGSSSQSCDLEVYFNNRGLATATCTPEEWTLDCSGTCGTSSCSFASNCFTSGNVSVGVYNANPQSINYFVTFSPVNVNPTALEIDTLVEADLPTTANTQSTYFSYAPNGELKANELLVFSAVSLGENSLDSIRYRESVIPGACNTTSIECSSEGPCTFTLSPCDYSTGTTLYFAVEASGPFSVSLNLLTSTVAPLEASTFIEGSLTVNASIQSYSFVIGEEQLANAASDVTVSVYGINQGTVDVWITSDSDCDIASDQFHVTGSNRKSNGYLVIPYCKLTAQTYFVNLRARFGEDLSCGSAITYGVTTFFGTSAAPATDLADGVSQTAPVQWESVSEVVDYYRFVPASGTVLSVDVVPSHPLVSVASTISGGDACGTEFEEHFEAWYCGEAPGSVLVGVDASAPVDLTVPAGESYSITASNIAFHNLTASNDTDAQFTEIGIQTRYYLFNMNANDAIQFDLNVIAGPAMKVQVFSDCGVTLIAEITCYMGHCYLPVSWANGDLVVSGAPYYLTVSGEAPGQYSLGIMVGESQTCVPVTGNTMCDVEWSVWNYGQGEAGMNGTNLASIRLYKELVTAFIPPCEEISKSCNESLIEFVCTQTYRACDYTGYQASICKDSCNDVEENCGMTFTQVGFPQFECNHNYYYSNDDEICEDIYDVISDDSDKYLWLILLIVLFFIVVIFVAVGGFFGYKKWKSHRGYETLDDGGQYQEVNDDDDD